MSDFRERLLIEQGELSTRTLALRNFVASSAIHDLSEIDRNDLIEQLQYMKGYLRILNRRVSRSCG